MPIIRRQQMILPKNHHFFDRLSDSIDLFETEYLKVALYPEGNS
jgi:hypothetical protein